MTIFTDKVLKYNSRLTKDLSISDVQSCGIWGNVGGETGGFSALQEKNPTVAGSAGGYGWLQWTGPRRRAYTSWCQSKSLDPASDEANYQYLAYETLNAEKHSLEQLRKTTTLEAATETFMRLNLRPGVPHLDVRQRWAQKAYEVVAKKQPEIPPVSVPEKKPEASSKPEAPAKGSWVIGLIRALFK